MRKKIETNKIKFEVESKQCLKKSKTKENTGII